MNGRIVSGIILVLLLTGMLSLAFNIQPFKAEVSLEESIWPMFHHDAQHTGRSSYLGPQRNNLVWILRLHATNSFTTSPAIGIDGTVYAAVEDLGDGRLYAIDRNGTIKWVYVMEGGIWYSSPALGLDGTIYVGARDGNLYAVNPGGTSRWNYSTGETTFGVVCAPTIDSNGIIYVGAVNGLHALKPDGTLLWKCPVAITVSSPAVGPSGIIYVGSLDGQLYAISHSGEIIWTYGTDASWVSVSPAIDADGVIYFAGYENGKFYAVNPNGALKWSYSITGTYFDSSAVIDTDNTVYVGGGTSLYAFYPNGTLKWTFPTEGTVGLGAAIGADGTVYFGSGDYRVYAVSRNGTLEWSFLTGGYVWGSPSIDSHGTLYIGDWNANLYAIGPDIVPSPPLFASINPLFASIYAGQSVTFTSTVFGGTPPYSYQWYLNGTPVSEAISSNWTFELQTTGNCSINLNVTDSLGNTAQSETANAAVEAFLKPVQTITMPPGVPTPFKLVEALGYMWFSTSCQQYIVRIDPAKILINVEEATKVSGKIAPDYDPNTGSSILDVWIPGLAYADGFLWTVASYSGLGTGCLVKFDPVTFNTTHFFEPLHCYGGFTNVIFDGNDTLYITSRDNLKLLKFSISQQKWLTDEYLDMTYGVYDAMLINNTIYFSGDSVLGIGCINIESGEKGLYSAPTAQNSVFMTTDKNGEIWFTSNLNHKVHHLLKNGTILEFGLGWTGPPLHEPDAPYGLVFDDIGNLWIAGFSAKVILSVNVSTPIIITEYPMPNQPFYITKDSFGNLWSWGLGSVEMNFVVAHNTAVIDIKPSKTIVGQGYAVCINATVQNQGDYEENFRLYVNATSIASQDITLANGNSATITFTWNTTNVPYGNYAINAIATTVLGEIDTTDNTCTSGTVTVAMVGDLNADGEVNILDITIVAIAFDSNVGDSRYNPNADINNDGKIEILDISILAVNFGKTA
ncbi:MAG TPA: PQQ-binding-like beta-propeller repeat protein [Candidatus Bathyarchaeia archaeon]